jgi:hypothetical protein
VGMSLLMDITDSRWRENGAIIYSDLAGCN